LGYYSNESLTVQKTSWGSSKPNPRSFPQIKQYPRRRKGRRGLPVARLFRWGGLGCRGGPEGHGDVRVAVGHGRSRPVHVCRRGSSSAVRSPAYPGHNWPIKWVRELHQGSRRVSVRGIEEQLTGLLGLRAQAGGRSPARTILVIRWSSARSESLGSFTSSWRSYPSGWRGLEGTRVGWPRWPRLGWQWRAEESSPELRRGVWPAKVSTGWGEARPGRLYRRGRTRPRAGLWQVLGACAGERQCALWRLARRRARDSAERGRVHAQISSKSLRLWPWSRWEISSADIPLSFGCGGLQVLLTGSRDREGRNRVCLTVAHREKIVGLTCPRHVS
jgi:hypothetical protein